MCLAPAACKQVVGPLPASPVVVSESSLDGSRFLAKGCNWVL
jgi:hypothetical protein